MLPATVTTWFLSLCLDKINFCAPEMSEMFFVLVTAKAQSIAHRFFSICLCYGCELFWTTTVFTETVTEGI